MTVSSTSVSSFLELSVSPNRRLSSENVHSAFQRLLYPFSLFH